MLHNLIKMVRRSSARRRSKKTRQYAKLPGARRRARRTSRKAVARTARLTVMRMAETQDADNRNTDVLVGTMNSTQWNIGAQCYSLTPNLNANNGVQINQGSSEGARKGNQIRTVKSTISFAGVAQGYNATTNPSPRPFYLKWWIFSGRMGVDLTDIADAQAIRLDFFESGSGTLGTTGTTLDMMRPINNEKYVVHKQGTHKMFFASYTGSGGTGTGDRGQQANNDFKMGIMKKLNVTKYMPKIIRFPDNEAAPPTSKPVWMAFATYYADGVNMPAVEAPVRLRILQDFKFKDF